MPQFAADGIGASVAAGLPNITGGSTGIKAILFEQSVQSGAFAPTAKVISTGWQSTSVSLPETRDLQFDASKSNPIYGASDTVQPPAIKLIPIIRY